MALFGKKRSKRKSLEDWCEVLADRDDWELKNIVKNPGEFVIEMRQAAATILQQRGRSPADDG